ncbi:MAG: hypothetical protein IJZ22_08630 [Bacteroidaceae bacterium]|nr:hypothetical protein [Bacteroidaceae bacterium]
MKCNINGADTPVRPYKKIRISILSPSHAVTPPLFKEEVAQAKRSDGGVYKKNTATKCRGRPMCLPKIEQTEEPCHFERM